MERWVPSLKRGIGGIGGGICAFLVGVVTTRLLVAHYRSGADPWFAQFEGPLFPYASEWDVAAWAYYGAHFVGTSWQEGPIFGENTRVLVATPFLWSADLILFFAIPVIVLLATTLILLHVLQRSRRDAMLLIATIAIGYGGIAVIGAFLFQAPPSEFDAFLVGDTWAPDWFVQQWPIHPDVGWTVILMGFVYPVAIGSIAYLGYAFRGRLVRFGERHSPVGWKTWGSGIAGGVAAYTAGLVATRPLIHSHMRGNEVWLGSEAWILAANEWDLSGWAFYSAHFVGISWEEGPFFGENASLLAAHVSFPDVLVFYLIPTVSLLGITLLLCYVLGATRNEAKPLIGSIAIGYGGAAIVGAILFGIQRPVGYYVSWHPRLPDLGWTIILMGLVYPLLIGSVAYALYAFKGGGAQRVASMG